MFFHLLSIIIYISVRVCIAVNEKFLRLACFVESGLGLTIKRFPLLMHTSSMLVQHALDDNMIGLLFTSSFRCLRLWPEDKTSSNNPFLLCVVDFCACLNDHSPGLTIKRILVTFGRGSLPCVRNEVKYPVDSHTLQLRANVISDPLSSQFLWFFRQTVLSLFLQSGSRARSEFPYRVGTS